MTVPEEEATAKSEAKRVLGRQRAMTTPWLTERHGYDPTLQRRRVKDEGLRIVNFCLQGR